MTTKEVTLALKVKDDPGGMARAQKGGKTLLDVYGKAKEVNRHYQDLDKSLAKTTKGATLLMHALDKTSQVLKRGGADRAMAALARETEKATRAAERLAAQQQRAAERQRHHQRGDPLQAMAREAQWMADQRAAAEKASHMNRRGFAMGVMQGSGVGEYFPEHGMRANVAGRLVGAAGRRAVGGMFDLASMPFTGAQGMLGAVSALPGGGYMAGQLQNGLQAAQGALQTRRTMFDLQYLLRGPGVGRAAHRAGASAAAGVQIPAFDPGAVKRAGEAARYSARAGFGDLVDRTTRATAAQQLGITLEEYEDRRSRAMAGGARGRKSVADREGPIQERLVRRGHLTEQSGRLAEADETLRQRKGIQAAQDNRDRARDNTKSAVLNASYESILSGGARFGLDPQAALQAAAEYGRASGGAYSQEQLNTAMAAKYGYGVDIGTTGALAKGERAGAFGGKRSMEDVLQAALRRATGLGLTGEGRADYLKTIATSVQEFVNSGIPVADESLGRIQQGFAASLGATRGVELGRQFGASLQKIGTGGPQSAQQMRALRLLGGYRYGEGAEGYGRARMNLATLNPETATDEAIQEYLSPAALREEYKDKPFTMGQITEWASEGQVNLPTAMQLQGKGPKEVADMFRRQRAAGAGEQGAMVPLGDVQAPSTLQKAAEEAVTKFYAGDKLIGTMQKLEATQTKMLEGVSAFSDTLEQAATWAEKTSKAVEEVTTLAAAALNKWLNTEKN